MANTQDVPFVKKYGQEVHTKFQQSEALTLQAVTSIRNVEGSTYRFPVVGTVEANTKARGADVTPLEIAHEFVDITLADYYSPLYFDKLDQLKTNISYRDLYVTATANGINRRIDQTIITALSAATNTITTITGGWTYAKGTQALEALMTANASEGERYMIVGPKQFSDMLAEDKVINGDYVTLRPAQSGKIGDFQGTKVIVSTMLPKASSTRMCFYFNKSAVALAMGLDPQTDVAYIDEKVAWLVNTYTSVGSAIIDNAGIIKVPCVEV